MATRFDTLCINCFGDRGSRSGPGPCPLCGFEEPARVERSALAQRTLLAKRYLIGRLLGKPGGFGITYKAWDLSERCIVAIKEFFPFLAAERGNDSVTVNRIDDETFEHGLVRFRDEAERLRTLRGTPHVVGVRDYISANGTAYIVMDFYDGHNLSEHIAAHGGRLPHAEVQRLAEQLGRGLARVHTHKPTHKLLHRDIKPANIYICNDGSPILLDFGSARFAAGERSQALSVLVTAGFAPFEQYQLRGRQGPWTDIYALSATLYYALTGVRPPQAPDRSEQDSLVPVRELVPDVPASLETAILRGLAVDANNRPSSVEEWLTLLGSGRAPGSESALGAKTAPTLPLDMPPPPTVPDRRPDRRWLEAVLAVSILGAAVGLIAGLYTVGVAMFALALWLALAVVLFVGLGRARGLSFPGLCIPGWNLYSLITAPVAATSTPAAAPPSPAAEPEHDAAARPSPMEVLAVFDFGPLNGAALPLGTRPAVLGRDPSAQLKLDTPEVSRRHLALSLDPGDPPLIRIEDLGSRNGTYVSFERTGGDWSEWTPLKGTLHVAVEQRGRCRVRLGTEGDQFHFE